MRLDGKVALVTGAGRGIGRAIAEAFVAAGATVWANGRDRAELDSIAGARPVLFDVRDEAAVKAGMMEVHGADKRLDILVNNAGILRDALVAMASTEMLDEVFSTNFRGTFLTCRLGARLMARQKSGSIINMSSIIGVEGNAGQSVYGASKAAVIGLTLSLAKELAPDNIRVNALAPGFIDTDMIKAVPEAQRARIAGQIRMGRLGTPADIAGAALFLASDLSGYVTGQVLGVDGGMTI